MCGGNSKSSPPARKTAPRVQHHRASFTTVHKPLRGLLSKMSVVMSGGKQYKWHHGEKKIHKLLKAERDSQDRADYVLGFMPPQHMFFFGNLTYFGVGTLDDRGRPWASILTGERGFIRPVNQNYLAMVTEVSVGDPVLENLSRGYTVSEGGRLIAGLGIDFTNRRRNKVAGRIAQNMLNLEDRELQMIITTDESLGNCPKYITIRDMKYQKREGVVRYQVPDMTEGSLPREALELIEQCDGVFLSARHLAADPKEVDDMDLNHRGGKPGFVRVEEDGRTLILPDYSGNLFYSTLGSIESDRLAGITFPNYTTGDILYVTGQAENLYGKEADKVMPRQKVLTRVRVTGYTYVHAGLNLVATQSHPSPYNPPIKYLASELPKLGKTPQDSRRDVMLVGAKRRTRDISTFTFEFPDGKPVNIIPGQHAILDFSAENSQGYQHMADDAPQSLNDDYVRSWTISSIPEIDENGDYLPSMRFSCTIKNKYGGAISPMLHQWGRRRPQTDLSIKFIGVEGAFSCFDDKHQLKEKKLLFLVGGVGITPFMTMLEVIRARNVKADIVLLFSARGEEGDLGKQFQETGIKTIIFDTGGEESDVDVIKRRIGYEDITAVPDLKERGVYMCGPDGFMNALKGYLEKAGVSAGNVNIESFAF